jgi:hypothetical protein
MLVVGSLVGQLLTVHTVRSHIRRRLPAHELIGNDE